jgi:hypothetical protein
MHECHQNGIIIPQSTAVPTVTRRSVTTRRACSMSRFLIVDFRHVSNNSSSVGIPIIASQNTLSE